MSNGTALFILFFILIVLPKIWSWFVRYMRDRERMKNKDH